MIIINGGITSGYIYNLKDELFHYNKSNDDVKKEVDLFNDALEKSYERLVTLLNKTTGVINDILKSHIAFIKDRVVNEEVVKRIKNNKESAGNAYNIVVGKYIDDLLNSNDEYLKERANDLLDIKEKVLREMYQKEIELHFEKPTILVVDSLKTSMILSLPENVSGVIARSGSSLSHAAILAKEKGIVFVVIKDINVDDGTFLTINTTNNIIKEEEKTLNDVKETIKKELKDDINLYLNISDLSILKVDLSNIYIGVGLVRSELLFMLDNVYPDYKKQVEVYKKILSFFYPKKVNIRLFDIKKDKEFFMFSNYDVDEFIFNGPLREIYQEQLKALIYANEPYGNLNIIIPMINNKDQYIKVKDYLSNLKEKKLLVNKVPKVGIMLETKKSFNNIDDFKDVDFINVGTNDLYVELYEGSRKTGINCQKSLKNLINDVKNIADFANKNEIPFTVCGDLASTEEGLKGLLSKGIKSFSIADGFLKQAVEVINNRNK